MLTLCENAFYIKLYGALDTKNQKQMIKTSIFSTIITMLLSGCFKEAAYLSIDSKINSLKIQPKEALKIAEKILDERGTYIWNDSTKLKTHIVKKGKYYYIKRSDFPAKTANWYTTAPAIKVNGKTGELIEVMKKR